MFGWQNGISYINTDAIKLEKNKQNPFKCFKAKLYMYLAVKTYLKVNFLIVFTI